MQCNQEIVVLHKQHVQSVLAWNCDFTRELWQARQTCLLLRQLNFCPLQLWVSHSHKQVILLLQKKKKMKITFVCPRPVTYFCQLPQRKSVCFAETHITLCSFLFRLKTSQLQ